MLHDIDKLAVGLPDLTEQLLLVLGHECESIDVITKLVQLS